MSTPSTPRRRGPWAGAALPCRQPSCKRHPCEYSEYPSEARPTGRCCPAMPLPAIVEAPRAQTHVCPRYYTYRRVPQSWGCGGRHCVPRPRAVPASARVIPWCSLQAALTASAHFAALSPAAAGPQVLRSYESVPHPFEYPFEYPTARPSACAACGGGAGAQEQAMGRRPRRSRRRHSAPHLVPLEY